jgi:hypothetical protein
MQSNPQFELILSRHPRIVMRPANRHAHLRIKKFCGNQRFLGGVSGTGVSTGLPAAQARRLSTTSCSILRRV